MTIVQRDARATRAHPCPICEGSEADRRGRSQRCTGYYSEDRTTFFCTREEYAGPAGALPEVETATGPAWPHKLAGPCKCGRQHGPEQSSSALPRPSLQAVKPGAPVAPGKRRRTFAEIQAWRERSGWALAKAYDIRDANGRLVAYHDRWERPTPNPETGKPDKQYAWRAADGLEGLGGLDLASLPLYPSDRLRPSELVVIVEGEKAAEALIGAGVQALGTACGAATTPGPHAWALLKGRKVAFWPDHDLDEQGLRHMRKCAEAARKAGVAAVQWVHWPDAPAKGDAADWLAQGHTVKELPALLRTAPPGEPEPERPYMSLRDLMAMEFGDPQWIVPGLIAEGLTAISGKPKMGKSWLVLTLALAKAAGGKFLGVDLDAGDVLYLGLEDRPQAMQERVRILLRNEPVPARIEIATSKDTDHWHMTMGGLEEMRLWLVNHPGGCIIIDTFARVKPRAKSNGNGYQDDYDHAKALKDVVDTAGGAILLVTHNRKASADDPFDEINATMGFAGAFDTGIVVRRNRGEADAVLHMDSRVAKGCELALAFDKETCLWRAMGDAEEYALGKERRSTLEAISKIERDNGQPGVRPQALATYLGVDTNTVYKRLHDMEASGQARSLSRGLYTIGKIGKIGKISKDGKESKEDPSVSPSSVNESYDLTDLTILTDLTNLTNHQHHLSERESERERAQESERVRTAVYRWGKKHDWQRILVQGTPLIEQGQQAWEAWLRGSDNATIAKLWGTLERVD